MIWDKIKKRPPRCAAVIVAAGSANRMQGTDKILADLCGKPAIFYTISAFQQCEKIQEIIVVTRENLIETISDLCRTEQLFKVKKIVPGGDCRPKSVSLGMDQVSKHTDLVAIHDGARPLVTLEVIERTIRAAESFHAAAPAVPVKDTIKKAENHIVVETPERRKLFAIQTPQVFDYDLLRGALQQAMEKDIQITDDCSAVEALGMSVYLTEGQDENIKITTPIDLLLAEAILKRRETI